METNFNMTLDREDGPLDIGVWAFGEVEPEDRSVGIMGDGISYVTIQKVVDVDGKAVQLTAYESERVETEAHKNLLKGLDSGTD